LKHTPRGTLARNISWQYGFSETLLLWLRKGAAAGQITVAA